MDDNNIKELNNSAWREKVYIETAEYVIKGYIFMPKTGKRTRLLSEVLNTNKTFIAVKDCTLESKLNLTRSVEEHEFMQVNVSTILLMRPIYE